MTDLEKVKEYIQLVEQIPESGIYLIEEEAAIRLGCSTYTIQRWAVKMGIKSAPINGIRLYMLHDIEKIRLRRKYNSHIKKFNKSSKNEQK